ncbi:MAG: hypothetical protein ACTH7X_08770 [Brevibacterium aurantiacum]
MSSSDVTGYLCALCDAPSDIIYHSVYMGMPIIKSRSLITLTTHWHSDQMGSETLKDLKERIRAIRESESS